MKSKAHTLFSICTLFVILWGLYGFHWYDCAKGTLLDSLSFSNLMHYMSFLEAIKCFVRIHLYRKMKKMLVRGL